MRRALKYLTKKYLKKHNVRDWLRVIASNKDRGCAFRPLDTCCWPTLVLHESARSTFPPSAAG